MKLKQLHYGWVMVILSIPILATNGIPFYSFGIFLKPITTDFNWERGALSAALSITMLVAGGLGIIAGRLSDKYGPRVLVTVNGVLAGIALLLMSQISSLWQVYLIWGLLLSIANSCVVIPVMSTIPRWFTKRRGIAMGIIVSGFGLGGVISPLLAQWLISAYGWRQTYIILGLITPVIITPLAQFMRHSPQRMGLKPYGENGSREDEQSLTSIVEGLSLKQAIKTSHFWVFGLILFSLLFAWNVIAVHIVPYAVDIGIPKTIAASLLSIFAGGNIIGKLTAGFISDKIGARLVLSACLILATLALIWLQFSGDVWTLYLFAAVVGIAFGGVVPLQNLIPAELFGLKFLGIIVATILFFGFIGGAIGPVLAGSIFDVTGSYRLAFLIALILCALATILSLILLRSKSKGNIAVTK